MPCIFLKFYAVVILFNSDIIQHDICMADDDEINNSVIDWIDQYRLLENNK